MVAPDAGTDRPILNIVGDQIALGPLRHDLVPLYQRWFNDLRQGRNFDDTPKPWSHEQMIEQFDLRASRSNDVITFTIYTRPDLRPIGYTMLVGISFRHRSAEFAIHIGEDDAHGKGYGTETTWLMLDYAFASLGLRSVHLTVSEHNLAGRRAYQRAGFRESGRRRQALLMGGRFWDQIIMDCLADEHLQRIAADTAT